MKFAFFSLFVISQILGVLFGRPLNQEQCQDRRDLGSDESRSSEEDDDPLVSQKIRASKHVEYSDEDESSGEVSKPVLHELSDEDESSGEDWKPSLHKLSDEDESSEEDWKPSLHKLSDEDELSEEDWKPSLHKLSDEDESSEQDWKPSLHKLSDEDESSEEDTKPFEHKTEHGLKHVVNDLDHVLAMLNSRESDELSYQEELKRLAALKKPVNVLDLLNDERI